MTETRMRRIGSGLLLRAAAIAVFLLVWQFVGAVAASESLPSALEVAVDLRERVVSATAWGHVLITGRRVVIATIATAVIGLSVGVAMGLSKPVESFFVPLTVVTLGIPGPVYIIMAILILGIGESSTMIALIVSVIPFVVFIAFEGTASRDRSLDQMAQVYGYSRRAYLRHVLLAQLTPMLFSGLRTAFALSWKLVVLMEALSASRGIGAQMVFFFRLLEPHAVVSYLVLFMVFMILVDRLLFGTVQSRLTAWSRRPTLEDVPEAQAATAA